MKLEFLRGVRWRLVAALAAAGVAPVAIRGFDPRLELLWLLGVVSLGGGLLLSLPGGQPQREGPLAGGIAGLAAGAHAAWFVQRWYDALPLSRPAEGAATVPLLSLLLAGLLAGLAAGALATWMQPRAPLAEATAAQEPRR